MRRGIELRVWNHVARVWLVWLRGHSVDRRLHRHHLLGSHKLKNLLLLLQVLLFNLINGGLILRKLVFVLMSPLLVKLKRHLAGLVFHLLRHVLHYILKASLNGLFSLKLVLFRVDTRANLR